MARVTVEDCLEREENRFALCLLAAQRCRQLIKGAHPLVQSKNKPAVTALREIATGKVHERRSSRMDRRAEKDRVVLDGLAKRLLL